MTLKALGGKEKVPGGLVKAVFTLVGGMSRRPLEKVSEAKRNTRVTLTIVLDSSYLHFLFCH